MGEMTAITAEVDATTLALLDQAAGFPGLSRDAFVAGAVRRVAESGADFIAFVQVGSDAIERGDVVSQEAMEAEFDEMIARRRAR